MNKNRLTEEELDKLLESGFVKLECDDGYFKAYAKELTVLKKSKLRKYITEDSTGSATTLEVGELLHYPSKSQPKTWYQVVYMGGYGEPMISASMYVSEEDFKKSHSIDTKILKMIPVYTEGE